MCDMQCVFTSILRAMLLRIASSLGSGTFVMVKGPLSLLASSPAPATLARLFMDVDSRLQVLTLTDSHTIEIAMNIS